MMISEDQLARVSDAISRIDPNLKEEWGLLLSLSDGARTVDIRITADELDLPDLVQVIAPAVAALKR